MRIVALSVFFMSGLLGIGLADRAEAQTVNRCVDAEGNSVFTDRDCGDLGIRERERPGLIAGMETESHRAPLVFGCAETPDDLVHRLRIAAEAGDVNRMSALYHWPGATRRSADATMAALRQVGARPVRGINLARVGVLNDPNHPANVPHYVILEHGSGFDQGSVDTTRFALVRNAGCWWIRF